MAKVKISKGVVVGGSIKRLGDIVDVSDADAKALIDAGAGTILAEDPPAEAPPAEDPPKPAKKATKAEAENA